MLKRITFTGADDQTKIDELLHLSDYHPAIEWGILLPPRGKGRFPSTEWIAEFVGSARLSSFKVQTAGHICGPWIERILEGIMGVEDLVGTAFDRIQLNTHGVPHELHPDWFKPMIRDAREFIIQLDGVSAPVMIQNLKAAGDGFENFSGLHDLSHGAGVLPRAWPQPVPELKWTGFAGGLGPENLATQLPLIAAAAGDADYWIDMETHVRTDGRFDLLKVRECLRIAQPFLATDVLRKINGQLESMR